MRYKRTSADWHKTGQNKMKNIATGKGRNDQYLNPLLISERADINKYQSEIRMREIALAIPDNGNSEGHVQIQSIVASGIHAAQKFLTEVATGLSMFDPFLADALTVCTSGQDVIDWLRRTQESQHGMIAPFPISGHMYLWERENYVPSYARSPSIPAVTLMVNYKDEQLGAVAVQYSVTEHLDMRSLAAFLNACGDGWEAFQKSFGVRAESDIPLPDGIEINESSAARYASAFVEHVVEKSEEVDDCPERLYLSFDVSRRLPLHQIIAGACKLMWAHSLYCDGAQMLDEDLRERAIELVDVAAEVGRIAANLHKDQPPKKASRKRKA